MIRLRYSGQVYHPAIGEELLIAAGAVHSARNIGATTAHWLCGYKRSRWKQSGHPSGLIAIASKWINVANHADH